jgi:hypothetical protein
MHAGWNWGSHAPLPQDIEMLAASGSANAGACAETQNTPEQVSYTTYWLTKLTLMIY